MIARFVRCFCMIVVSCTGSMLGGCAVLFPATVRAVAAGALVEIDGVAEGAWDAAEPVHVDAVDNIGGEETTAIEIRAMHGGGEIAFLFRWEDETRSDSFREYVMSAEGEGGGSSVSFVGVPDDQFALKFNLSGSALSCMLAGKDYEDDVWHWKAARTNPAGYAQDRRFVVRREAEEGDEAAGESGDEAGSYVARNGSPVQILWIEDEGEPLVVELEPLRSIQEVNERMAEKSGYPTFEIRKPAGSQADVRAKAKWDDGVWTLEIARRLDTGHADDAVIDREKTSKFAIAVFDASEGQVHDNTRWIKLKLE